MRVNKSVVAGWCLVSLLSMTSVGMAADDTRVAQAARLHDLDAVRALVKQQVNVNTPLPDGATALHWAAQWDDFEMANALVIAKADVNIPDVYGVTPLSLACVNGSAQMVSLLLRAGANPNAVLPSGETPLMTASRTGRPKAVSSLIEARSGRRGAREDPRTNGVDVGGRGEAPRGGGHPHHRRSQGECPFELRLHTAPVCRAARRLGRHRDATQARRQRERSRQ